MELIHSLKIKEDSLEFIYASTNQKKILANVGYTIAEYFKFIKPAKGSENHQFIRIFNGNSTESNGGSFYVLVRPEERTHYLIKSDIFRDTFKNVESEN